MRLNESTHLTFCMNIFPGESLEDCLSHIENQCLEIKQKFCPDKPLALGLRLAEQAASELSENPDKIAILKTTLEKHNLYAVTINAFPFGNFHTAPVKEKVYFPDWNEKQRLDYSLNCARILAQLLPKGAIGSISTVPITYGKKLPEKAIENILICAKELALIEKDFERKVLLALEPEPDCYLEDSDECLDFFAQLQKRTTCQEELAFIGICFDTCHLSLQFEDLIKAIEKLAQNNIPIAKVQLSAVPILPEGRDPNCLAQYHEGIYLHQTRVKNERELLKFPDLGPALERQPAGEWRTHFHIPLDFNGHPQGLQSSNEHLTSEFLQKAAELSPCLETETYTYQVFPESTKAVEDSLCSELNWVLTRLKKS